jgi:hypothetical protein
MQDRRQHKESPPVPGPEAEDKDRDPGSRS